MNKFRELYKGDMETFTPSEKLREETLHLMKEEDLSLMEKSKKYRWSVVLPIAASLILTVSAVAAVIVPRFLTPSERGGYEGHIYSQNTEDTPVEKNMTEDLWTSIGTDINETVTGGNLTVTLKDIVYDNMQMYINFDISTNDGSALQENTEFAKSLLYRQTFNPMYIECDGQKYELGVFRIDNAATPDKASFECFADVSNFLDKDIRLVLSNFEDTVERSSDIGFTFGSLAEACETLTPVEEDDFINIGTYSTYADGTKSYVYTIPQGTQKIYFSEKYPEAYIDAIGFQTVGGSQSKALYLSIVSGTEQNTADIAAYGFAFKNIVTGDVITSYYPEPIEVAANGSEIFYTPEGRPYFLQDRRVETAEGEFEVINDMKMMYNPESMDASLNEGRLILTLSERGRETDMTESDLADYVMVGITPEPEETFIREYGTWSFELRLDADAAAKSKTFDINQEAELNGGTMTVDSITLSPFNLFIKGSAADTGGKPNISSTFLIMKDGSRVIAEKKGGNGLFGETIDLDFLFDRPVNVDDIQGISFQGVDFILR